MFPAELPPVRNRMPRMPDSQTSELMDERAVHRALARMARQIVEQVGGTEALALVGIHRRGVPLAEWLAQEIRRAEDAAVPTGAMDITLYRDDLMAIGPRPVVGETRLPEGGIDERTVVIVDDVLFTGRTVRAALDELADFGRPRRILLCVLVDRGGRELPIHADIIGKTVQMGRQGRIEVRVPALDGRWGVDRSEGTA